MTFADFVAKLPEDEREELTQILADRLSSLTPQNKGFALAEHTLNIQKKIREHGGLITQDQADDKMHDELVQAVPKLQRFAVKVGNAALYRDLEKYSEQPEIALIKNYSLNSFVQAVKERRRQLQEQQKQKQQDQHH